MANQFSIQPANPNYGLQGLLGGIERGQQRDVAAQEQQMQQQKLAQQQQIMGSYFDAMDSGDVGAQREIMRNNPILMKQLKEIESTSMGQKERLKNQMADDVVNKGMNQQQVAQKYGANMQALGMDVNAMVALSFDARSVH